MIQFEKTWDNWDGWASWYGLADMPQLSGGKITLRSRKNAIALMRNSFGLLPTEFSSCYYEVDVEPLLPANDKRNSGVLYLTNISGSTFLGITYELGEWRTYGVPYNPSLGPYIGPGPWKIKIGFAISGTNNYGTYNTITLRRWMSINDVVYQFGENYEYSSPTISSYLPNLFDNITGEYPVDVGYQAPAIYWVSSASGVEVDVLRVSAMRGAVGATPDDISRFIDGTPRVFGSLFDGFDRGMRVTIERNIREVPTLGGPPRLIEVGPSNGALDRWVVESSFRVDRARAAAFEAAAPPYGTGPATIKVPPRFGEASFPGLAPAVVDDTGDSYNGVSVRSLESTGQVGVVTDLYGYTMTFELCCSGQSANNVQTTPTTTLPPTIQRKFRAHQLNDFSTVSVAGSAAGMGQPQAMLSKAGRRYDIGVNLDHLTIEEADALVAWFRGVRVQPFALPFAPLGSTSTQYIAKSLSFQRAGSWWDGSLEVIKA